MKTKLTAVISALAIMCPLTSFVAQASDRVEINFSVGDSVLMVNGSGLEVTAPYVVGDGTTLVPVRVITEAFGAEVGWDGATQTVTLDYPDVSISLTIGSSTAVVNDHTEQLAAAPELYNGTTMVPLRFISETFDATVTYDDATQRITVVKDSAAAQQGETQLQTGTDQAYIGDSYYGWSMKNPTILEMEDRTFDGRATLFTNETGSIGINIITLEEDETSDDVYNSALSVIEGMTTSIAEKETNGLGVTNIHLRAKDSDITVDLRAIVKEGMAYMIVSTAENDASDINEILDIASSFGLTKNDDVYDLSNVTNGSRLFESDELKISMQLPADYYQTELSMTNAYAFNTAEDEQGNVVIGVYSKSDTVSAEASAREDRNRYIELTDPHTVKVSNLEDTTVNGRDAKEYTVSFYGDGTHGTYVMKDVFFEIGDYVYNLTCEMTSETDADKVISSLKADELDSDKVGTILKDASIDTEESVEVGSRKIPLHKDWKQITEGDIVLLMHDYTDATLTISEIADSNAGDTEDYLEYFASDEYRAEAKEQNDGLKGVTCVKGAHSVTIGAMDGYMMELRYDYDTNTRYDTIYSLAYGGDVYLFIFSRSDIYRDGGLKSQVREMITGLRAV